MGGKNTWKTLFVFFIFVFKCTDCSPVFSQYLVKCHQFLRSVPVPLRLEVLENIFSLLFVSYSDLHSDNLLPEDYAEDDDLDKKSSAVSVEGSASRRSSASESPQHLIKAEKKLERYLLAAQTDHLDTQNLPDLEQCGKSCESSRLSYPDLKHFTSSVTGFLVDDVAMDAFLTLLLNHLEEIQSSLPWDSSNVLREELELVECLNLSASRDGFGSRVLQFSKYLSEAHWRYKVVMSNRNAGRLCIWHFLVYEHSCVTALQAMPFLHCSLKRITYFNQKVQISVFPLPLISPPPPPHCGQIFACIGVLLTAYLRLCKVWAVWTSSAPSAGVWLLEGKGSYILKICLKCMGTNLALISAV